MTKIRAYTALQDQFGREQAQVLAEFIESVEGPDLGQLATKDDVFVLKDDITALKSDLKDLEIRLLKELAKSREDMIRRTSWATIIQVLATIGAMAALAKLI